jgi:hypothetical protein
VMVLVLHFMVVEAEITSVLATVFLAKRDFGPLCRLLQVSEH